VNPPGNERACCDVLSDYFRTVGIQTEIIEYEKGRANVVAKIRGKSDGPSLLLNGHLDTVSIGEGWHKDPFGGEVEDGKMFGRGTSDMKSGVAAVAASLKSIAESGVELDGDLIFTAVADEESFGPAGTKYLLEKGIRADAAIVTEPTDLQIEIAQRGILWLNVVTEGRAAHGGRPWLGVNAIQQMVDFLTELRNLEPKLAKRKHDLVLSPSINVGTIKGGTRVNIVASSCSVEIDRRTIPGETTKQALEEIDEILQKLRAGVRPFKATFEILADSDAFEIPRDHRLVESLQEAAHYGNGIEQAQQQPKITGKDATSDAALLFRAGMPTLLFGPGQYKVSHTSDEYVELDKLASGTKILAASSLLLTSAQKM